MSGTRYPSTPWTWTGGYPQRITGPDATLIAECWENPDRPATIAPLICAAVNVYLEAPLGQYDDQEPRSGEHG